jgi:hypothetical protein
MSNDMSLDLPPLGIIPLIRSIRIDMRAPLENADNSRFGLYESILNREIAWTYGLNPLCVEHWRFIFSKFFENSEDHKIFETVRLMYSNIYYFIEFVSKYNITSDVEVLIYILVQLSVIS